MFALGDGAACVEVVEGIHPRVGGLPFSLPLIYKMEAWHTEVAAEPERLLVVLVIGQLVFDAVATGNEPPRLEIMTGVAARIEVSIGDERGEFEIDYLPRHSNRKGWVTFTHPPGQLKTRVLGFKTP